MKKLIPIIILALLLGGCAMYQVERTRLADNTFKCNMPSVTFKLSSDFVYIGEYNSKYGAKDVSPGSSDLGRTTTRVEEYYAWQSKDKSKLVVVYIVTLKNPQWRFSRKGLSKLEAVEIAGKEWHTKMWYGFRLNNEYYKRLTDIVPGASRSYKIVKEYRRVGISSNMMPKIYYLSKDGEGFTPDKDITILAN